MDKYLLTDEEINSTLDKTPYIQTYEGIAKAQLAKVQPYLNKKVVITTDENSYEDKIRHIVIDYELKLEKVREEVRKETAREILMLLGRLSPVCAVMSIGIPVIKDLSETVTWKNLKSKYGIEGK